MSFKYQELIDEQSLTVECPPNHLDQYSGEAFRFCKETISKNDFLPTLLVDRTKNPPPRRNFESDNERCKACSLSLFESKEAISKKFKSFPKRTKQLLGFTHIAKGGLDEEDGLASEVERSGHFSFFEYEKAHIAKKFTVIEPLS